MLRWDSFLRQMMSSLMSHMDWLQWSDYIEITSSGRRVSYVVWSPSLVAPDIAWTRSHARKRTQDRSQLISVEARGEVIAPRMRARVCVCVCVYANMSMCVCVYVCLNIRQIWFVRYLVYAFLNSIWKSKCPVGV